MVLCPFYTSKITRFEVSSILTDNLVALGAPVKELERGTKFLVPKTVQSFNFRGARAVFIVTRIKKAQLLKLGF